MDTSPGDFKRIRSMFEATGFVVKPSHRRTQSFRVPSYSTDSEEEDNGYLLTNDEKPEEIKIFLKEEEEYCCILKDLIQSFVSFINVDNLKVLFEGIRNISLHHNSTFLPDLKRTKNALGIVTCFLKHKTLFNVYYDSYFKNQENMNFVMCENRSSFMLYYDEDTYKKYEDILLTVPNKRIQEYQVFLENLRETVVKQNGVHHLNRAISSVSVLIQNFQKHDKNIRYIISEIGETERLYLEKLRRITEEVVPHLETIIPQKSRVTSIVGEIPQIYSKQIEFYNHLKIFLFEFNPDDVGRCFLLHENLFKLYVKDQEKKHNSDALEEYMNFLKTTSQRDVDFYAPLHRLTKYKLLLQKLMEACITAQVPSATLAEALEMISTIILEINAIAAIKSVRHENLDLDTQGQLICRNEFRVQWKMSEYDKIEEYSGMVFLFEKSIVFTEIKSEVSSKRVIDVYIYKSHIMTKCLGLYPRMKSTNNVQIYFHGKEKKLFHILSTEHRNVIEEWHSNIKYILTKQLIEIKENLG